MSPDEASKILQIIGDGSDDEVRAAYARLVLLAHPDHGGDPDTAADRLRELRTARDTLLAISARKMQSEKVEKPKHTCATCGGKGFVVTEFTVRECRTCGGSGRTRLRRI